MAVDLAALATEISVDPQVLGFAGKNDGQIAALLNAIGGSGETLEPENITNIIAQKAVDGAEFLALTTAQQNLWLAILTIATIPVKDAVIRAQVTSVWAAGTTRTNLIALQTRSASRSEILCGEGVSVTTGNVAIALRG